jgi:hypothetical protein
LIDLGEIYPDSGLSDSKVALFYAEITGYGKPEHIEAITDILRVSIAEFERMIRDSDIKDGFLLAAYARAKVRNLI